MVPFEHPSSNHKYLPPADWDQSLGACVTLPVTVTLADTGYVLSSYWRPSAEELQALNAGKALRLDVFGRQHPAVFVGVEE